MLPLYIDCTLSFVLLPPQSAAPTANTDPYAPTFPPIFPGRGAFFARSYFLERDRRAFFV